MSQVEKRFSLLEGLKVKDVISDAEKPASVTSTTDIDPLSTRNSGEDAASLRIKMVRY